MKKRIVSIFLAACMLSVFGACGGAANHIVPSDIAAPTAAGGLSATPAPGAAPQQTEIPTQTATSSSEDVEAVLGEMCNWMFYEIGNDLWNVEAYTTSGTMLQGDRRTIAEVLEDLASSMESAEDYNVFIEGLNNSKYDSLKKYWKSFYNKTLSLYNQVMTETPISDGSYDFDGEEFKTYLSNCFSCIYDALKIGPNVEKAYEPLTEDIRTYLNDIHTWISSVWADEIMAVRSYVGGRPRAKRVDIDEVLKELDASMITAETYDAFVKDLDQSNFSTLKTKWASFYSGLVALHDQIKAEKPTADGSYDFNIGKLSLEEMRCYLELSFALDAPSAEEETNISLPYEVTEILPLVKEWLVNTGLTFAAIETYAAGKSTLTIETIMEDLDRKIEAAETIDEFINGWNGPEYVSLKASWGKVYGESLSLYDQVTAETPTADGSYAFDMSTFMEYEVECYGDASDLLDRNE